MHEKQSKPWVKHFDFMVLDLLCMQLCFCLSYWMNSGWGNPYATQAFRLQATVIFMAQIAVMLFSSNYRGILRRGKLDEFAAIIKYTVLVLAVALVYLFLTHETTVASRLQFGFTFVFFVLLSNPVRHLNKIRIFKTGVQSRKSLVIVTSSRLAAHAVEGIAGEGVFTDYVISGIVTLDGNAQDLETSLGIPCTDLGHEAMDKLLHGWIDEILILQPEDKALPMGLMDNLMKMGITVNYTMAGVGESSWSFSDVRKLGNYQVLTSSIKLATTGQLALKRTLDIVGGLIGCLITGILFIFIAPAIYIKSPGPVFFKQKRMGRNGRVFEMYKFRSMYLDAEERKAALMVQNKIEDGMMFKMDDDPRIIGSEKKGPDGRPRGIGNFIRKTSIDEFPQFFNVVKGDMSLVGTRPPTLDEWEKYDLGHRIRMSIKPGITGMWQISGRSEITDFEEVVRLDREYIDQWSVWLDAKILAKTIVVVLKRKGAE